MISRLWLAVLMVLTMSLGIAHATLHLVTLPDTDAGHLADADCPLATVDHEGKADSSPPPGWAASASAVPAPGQTLLPKHSPPWRSRAPPVAR